jgi:hypothetical protein
MPIKIEAEVFGRAVDLGFAEGPTRVVVTDVEPMPDNPHEVAVTFMPQDAEAKIVPVTGLRRSTAARAQGQSDEGELPS